MCKFSPVPQRKIGGIGIETLIIQGPVLLFGKIILF